MKHMSESSEGPGLTTPGKTGGENQFRRETTFGSFDCNVLKHLIIQGHENTHKKQWYQTLNHPRT
jgi:hypothetical protein